MGKKTKSSEVFAMIFICSALNMSRRILKLGENTFKMESRIDKSYKYAKKNYRKKRRNNLTRCQMDAIHTFNLYVVFSVIFVFSSQSIRETYTVHKIDKFDFMVLSGYVCTFRASFRRSNCLLYMISNRAANIQSSP